MKRYFLIPFLVVSLSGCAAIDKAKTWIPSFWDDNQSAKIVDIRFKSRQIDCTQPQLPQARAIQNDITWFELYSESKGSRQQDVLKLIAPMKETVDDWVKRSENKEGSKTYCEIKKKMVEQQSKRAAEAVLGRF
jgi:hypothetical protein